MIPDLFGTSLDKNDLDSVKRRLSNYTCRVILPFTGSTHAYTLALRQIVLKVNVPIIDVGFFSLNGHFFVDDFLEVINAIGEVKFGKGKWPGIFMKIWEFVEVD